MNNVPLPGEPKPPAPPPPPPFPEPEPVREPDAPRLPDEEPLPNPDENDDAPRHVRRGLLQTGAATVAGLRRLALPLMVAALVTSPARAQEPQPEPRSGVEPCSAVPEGLPDEAEENRGPREEELTEKLEPCDGVLAPPDIGEAEIIQPPPDVGRTPVIHPGDVPSQPAGEPDG